MVIRCCLGSNEERLRDKKALHEADTLVLDPSSLATLFFSGHYQHLGLLPKKLVVCESALQKYRAFLSPSKADACCFSWKLKEKTVVPSEVADFLAKIQSVAKIESGQRLDQVPSETRQSLIDRFGQATAEAVAEAGHKGAVLWSDDLEVAEWTRAKLGTKRVWTQLVFKEGGKIPLDVYVDMTFFLLKEGYSLTRIQREIFLAACNRASWDPKNAPLKTVLEWLATPEMHHVSAGQVCMNVVPLVWRMGPKNQRREEVTRALVGTVLAKQNGIQSVHSIRNHIQFVAKLNAGNKNRCLQVIHGLLGNQPPKPPKEINLKVDWDFELSRLAEHFSEEFTSDEIDEEEFQTPKQKADRRKAKKREKRRKKH